MKNYIVMILSSILFAILTVTLAHINNPFISIPSIIIIATGYSAYMQSIERSINKWLYINDNVHDKDKWSYIHDDINIRYIPGYHPIIKLKGAHLVEYPIINALLRKTYDTANMIEEYEAGRDLKYKMAISMNKAEAIIEYLERASWKGEREID